MKHILMIAPRSIPVYGAEEIVNLKLLKALSDSGHFKIDLISRLNKTVDYPYDSHDADSVKLNNHHIVEVDNRVTPEVVWQHCKALLRFGCVFRGAHWAAQCVPVADKLVANTDYDYVVTKSESSFLLGYYLKKKYGVKWVATWNDPYPFYKCPPPYGDGPGATSMFDARILSMLRSADIHVFANCRLKDYVIGYMQLNESSTRIAPHVILRKQMVTQKERRSGDTLRLIASGNMRAPRDPRPFLRALKRLLTENPEAKIKFSMLGLLDVDIQDIIADLDLSRFVSVLSPVPYGESLTALVDYDVAVIFEADCKEGIFLPTKVGDCMQSGVNIFAVSPETGVLHDLYADSKIGYFSPVSDEANIYDELKRLYSDFLNRNLFTPTISEDYLDFNITETYLKI